MRFVPDVLERLAASMPSLALGEFDACVEKLGRYLVSVANAEGPGGIGDRMMQRFPVHELAIVTLGHAITQQSFPDALMPGTWDVGDRASHARVLYAQVGCRMLCDAPDIQQPGGIYAAAGVACALAAQVKLAQQAALSPQALEADMGKVGPEATSAALTFVEHAIALQALLDARSCVTSSEQCDGCGEEVSRL